MTIPLEHPPRALDPGKSVLLLIDFQAHDDYDHVAALFRRGGRWGTISKSNHVALRHRERTEVALAPPQHERMAHALEHRAAQRTASAEIGARCFAAVVHRLVHDRTHVPKGAHAS